MSIQSNAATVGNPANIVDAGVQYIIDSIVDELAKNESRFFSYAETGFFWRWWVEQTADKQALVKQMVDAGRLQWIGGGWTQNDEATSHYLATIDQMSYGLRKINETFGTKNLPVTAWQIDPFGHSRGNADLYRRVNRQFME